jgi:hypothetical protein
VPAAQGVHDPDNWRLKVPAAQVEHTPLLRNLPAGHGVHIVEPYVVNRTKMSTGTKLYEGRLTGEEIVLAGQGRQAEVPDW